MNDILTVSGLNKSYGDFSLKDVTFSLPEGCITGFIGVNGAGKTTTLRTLLGLTNKLSGKIQFFGLDMDKNEREIKDRIGIVLDGGGFYEELSLGEMKTYPCTLHGLNRILSGTWICFRLTRSKKSIAFPKV